jgi:glycosyltransferase involved in cell wall biosynthesis
MGSELLTAIIPIGPNHIEHNRIFDWLYEANRFSENLKLLLIEDTGDVDSYFPQSDRMYLGLKNFEIHRKKLGGPGQARNFGLTLVQSPWVCFWDSDDLPRISAVFQSIFKAIDSNSEVVIGDFERVVGPYRNDKTLSEHKPNLRQVAIEPGIWRMAFNTKIIEEIEFESIRMAEDQIFLLDLDLADREIFFSDDVLYSYFVGSSNQLTSDTEAKQELTKAIHLIHKRIKLGDIQVNEFTALMLVKLSLTFIKSSTFKRKRIAIYSLLKSLKLLSGFRKMTISYLLKTNYDSYLRRVLNDQ